MIMMNEKYSKLNRPHRKFVEIRFAERNRTGCDETLNNGGIHSRLEMRESLRTASVCTAF